VGQAAVVFGRNLEGKWYTGGVVGWNGSWATGRCSCGRRQRKALDALEVFIDLGPDFKAPLGLQVDVKVQVAN
jgi:hypothetical protein